MVIHVIIPAMKEALIGGLRSNPTWIKTLSKKQLKPKYLSGKSA
jgi:hypothetical protein